MVEKLCRVLKFYEKGAGCQTSESNVDLDRFIVINERIYSARAIDQIVKKDGFKCPGGHIDLLGVEFSFRTGVTEYVSFDAVEDRNLFYQYITRWLFDDETYNVIEIYFYRKEGKHEDN